MAVDTVPSMPATPRFDRTLTPWVFSPTSAASRTGLDAPSTSWSPSAAAPSATAAATCRPVVSGWAASWSRTASTACAFTSAHRRSQPGSGVPVVTARVPVACELPDTSGQRGPVVSANTGTDGSASSVDTGRCSVGRPSMITCCGRSSGSASGCSGFAAGGAVGSATVGRCARLAVHAGAVAGDDEGVRRQVDVERLVERHRRGVGPRLAVGPARRVRRSPGVRRRRAPAARAAGCRTAPARRWRCENPWRPPRLDTSPIATAR